MRSSGYKILEHCIRKKGHPICLRLHPLFEMTKNCLKC